MTTQFFERQETQKTYTRLLVWGFVAFAAASAFAFRAFSEKRGEPSEMGPAVLGEAFRSLSELQCFVI